MILYSLKFMNQGIKKYVVIHGFIFLILTSVFLFLCRPIILIGFTPFLILLILFEKKLNNFRTFLKQSLYSTLFSNLFDILFVLLLYFLKKNDLFYTKIVDIFKELNKVIELPEEQFVSITGTLILLVLFFIIPVIRSIGILKLYKKQHNIVTNKERVFWNSGLFSFFWSMFISSLYFSFFLLQKLVD